jgi:tungstate transport system substrate-binding protein
VSVSPAATRSVTAALVVTAAVLAGCPRPLDAQTPRSPVILSTTTSTQDSGLLDVLVPMFERQSGYTLKTVAVGTGQALALAARGEADVVLAHAPALEKKYVAEGRMLNRRLVMYNDFVLIGPAADPAGVKRLTSAVEAMKAIARTRSRFVSRGDNSGTHAAELNLWKVAGVDIAQAKGPWYRDIGQGMGAALNAASAGDAYTLSDRGTWLSFKNRGDLGIAVEGDPRLFNQYGVILVNPERHPHVKAALGQAFIDWITGPEGQAAIAGHRIGGEQLFFPNAHAEPLRKAS